MTQKLYLFTRSQIRNLRRLGNNDGYAFTTSGASTTIVDVDNDALKRGKVTPVGVCPAGIREKLENLRFPEITEDTPIRILTPGGLSLVGFLAYGERNPDTLSDLFDDFFRWLDPANAELPTISAETARGCTYQAIVDDDNPGGAGYRLRGIDAEEVRKLLDRSGAWLGEVPLGEENAISRGRGFGRVKFWANP